MSKTTVCVGHVDEGVARAGADEVDEVESFVLVDEGEEADMQAWHPRDCIFMLLTPGAVFQWRVLVRLPPVPQHLPYPALSPQPPYLPLPFPPHVSLPFSHRTPPAAIP